MFATICLMGLATFLLNLPMGWPRPPRPPAGRAPPRPEPTEDRTVTLPVILMAVATFLLNLPMGYWREGTRKFSWQWIVAIHAMVPVVILMRKQFHVGFAWWSFLITIPCYFGGQFVGARLRRRAQAAAARAQQTPGAA